MAHVAGLGWQFGKCFKIILQKISILQCPNKNCVESTHLQGMSKKDIGLLHFSSNKNEKDDFILFI